MRIQHDHLIPYRPRPAWHERLYSDDVIRLFIEEPELPQWIIAAWGSLSRFLSKLFLELEYWDKAIWAFALTLHQATQGKRPVDTRFLYQEATGLPDRVFCESTVDLRGKLHLFGGDTPLEYLIDMQGTYAGSVSWIFLRHLLARYIATQPQERKIVMSDTVYEESKDLYDTPLPEPILPGFSMEGLLEGLDEKLTEYLEGKFGSLDNIGTWTEKEVRQLYAAGVRTPQIQSVITAAREGRIHGGHYLHEDRTGCVYAHIRVSEADDGSDLESTISDRLPQWRTPLERIVWHVRDKDLPETSDALTLLIQIMERFLAALPAEVPATTTMEETHA